MAVELSDDTLYTGALPATARVFGALSSIAAEPTSFGREAIINTAKDGLATVATTGSATDLTSGTLPLGRLHAWLADISSIASFETGDMLYFNGSDVVALPVGDADGQLLKLVGGIPVWSTVDTLDVEAALLAAEAAAAAAAVSETNAASSASSAATSASNASTSASTASTQASNASTSASAASTSASAASTSATNATTSASSASTSATTATTQAGLASTSASAAATSASGASTSASSASTSASTATTQASNASASASAASTSASDASTSATSAATSATNAAASVGFTWTYSTTTTMAAPGTGSVRFNSGTLASVTAIAISMLSADSGNPDVGSWIRTWDDSTNATGKGLLRLRVGASTYIDVRVDSLTDNTTWAQLAVTYVGSSGIFSNGATAISHFARWGDKGSDGAGAGDVTAAAAFATDNVLVRSDGTGKGVQFTGISVDDSNNVTGVTSLDVSVAGGLKVGAVKTLDADGTNTYTRLSDPEGTPRLLLGDSDDPISYHRNWVHRFQSANGATVFANLSATGLDLLASTALSFGAIAIISDSAGTTTLSNIDALDATTEATIEAAIDTLANLTSIQGVAFTFGAYAATVLNNADEAAFKAAVNLEANTDFYAPAGTDVPVTDGGTGRSTGTTAYSLVATGTTATGAQQTLANGATTEILVGGGAAALPVWTTAQGSGAPVRATSPTLTTPNIGTPSAGTLTSCTGLPVSTGISGLGTGVATALAVAVGSAGAPVVNGGALGTPSSGTLTNCTGLPASGLVASTSQAVGFGTIELGAASDTTISRDSAGVIAVEGVPLYSNIPQNSQSAAYTLVLADAQKHIYHPGADTTARIWTIPANSSVAYPIGTALTFVNDTSAGIITIAITSDTLVLAGAGTTGSRSLAANGVATAIKMTSTRWMISGTGLT